MNFNNSLFLHASEISITDFLQLNEDLMIKTVRLCCQIAIDQHPASDSTLANIPFKIGTLGLNRVPGLNGYTYLIR